MCVEWQMMFEAQARSVSWVDNDIKLLFMKF